MADKQETLARIRAALGRDKTIAPKPLASFTPRAVNATDEELTSRFCLELERVSARVTRISSADEIKNYLKSLLPKDAPATVAVSDSRALIDAGLREWLAERGANILPTLKEFASSQSPRVNGNNGAELMESYKRELVQASIGVTSADYGIADTGTLVLVSGSEQHRLISLVPPVHVCLLDSKRIVATLHDLITRARAEHYSNRAPQAMTFITGPSRTADIELTLTLGVHGPRELHVLLHSHVQ
ncbi:MAG TPA: lactate utilization protein [Blastocatellia bacterium]|nr:lactate utilization protein [Blastocatellia bacterium]